MRLQAGHCNLASSAVLVQAKRHRWCGSSVLNPVKIQVCSRELAVEDVQFGPATEEVPKTAYAEDYSKVQYGNFSGIRRILLVDNGN